MLVCVLDCIATHTEWGERSFRWNPPYTFASLPGLICVLWLTVNLLYSSGLAVSLSHLLSLCVLLHMCSGSLIGPHKNLGWTDLLSSVSLLTVLSFQPSARLCKFSFISLSFFLFFWRFPLPITLIFPRASLSCLYVPLLPLSLSFWSWTDSRSSQAAGGESRQRSRSVRPPSLSGEANYCRHTNKL